MRRVLLVTTARDLAADLVILHLARRNIPFERFNQENFPERTIVAWPGDGSLGALTIRGNVMSCAEIGSAWFRHASEPALPAAEDRRTADFIIRECAGFLDGFWETMPWFWMNRPSAVAASANKLRQLARAKAFKFRIPDTLVTNCPKAARDFVGQRASIAKPVVSGGLTDDGRRDAVYTTPVTRDDFSDDDSVRAAPMILQERIANAFDLRVTVVGSRVFATRILARDRDDETDWRAVDPSRIAYEPYVLPAPLEANCIALVKAFSLSFGALDFVVTPDGDHVFLELNPSGQWGWLEGATGDRITDAIVDQLAEGAL